MSVRHAAVVWCLGFSIPLVSAADASAQGRDVAARIRALGWQEGPTQADLGGIATIQIPDGYRFLGKGPAGKFMELLENPSDGSELGVIAGRNSSWFVVFEFSGVGYVKDDDRKLDASGMLSSIKSGTEAANKIRRERGWATMEVLGWQQEPFYDPATHNLTWSIRGGSGNEVSINHSTRLLGRRGVMEANLVLSPDEIDAAVPAFNAMLGGFSFKSGQTYAEFTRGDKIAEYGLAGLIVGGAGVALFKTGLFQKFFKLIVVGVMALLGAIGRFFKSLFGGGGAQQTAEVPVPASSAPATWLCPNCGRRVPSRITECRCGHVPT